MSLQRLAEKMGKPVHEVEAALDAMCIDLMDYSQNEGAYEAELRNQLGISGGLTVAAPQGLATTSVTSVTSTKTKAPAAKGKLAKAKTASLDKRSQQAEQAKAVQTALNSSIEAQMIAIADDARATVDSIDGFTQTVGHVIGQKLVDMPMAIGNIAAEALREGDPAMGVNFRQFDILADNALEGII